MLVLLPLSQPVRERVIRLLSHPQAVPSLEGLLDLHYDCVINRSLILDIYQPEAESLTNVKNTRHSYGYALGIPSASGSLTWAYAHPTGSFVHALLANKITAPKWLTLFILHHLVMIK